MIGAYRDECTERSLDAQLTGIIDSLTLLVARAERSAALSSLPGAEDDLEYLRR